MLDNVCECECVCDGVCVSVCVEYKPLMYVCVHYTVSYLVHSSVMVYRRSILMKNIQ